MVAKRSRRFIVGLLVAIGLPATASAEPQWVEGTPMPDADAQRLAVDGGDGHIYLFGGRAAGTAAHRYDVDADSFNALEDLPHATAAPCGDRLDDGRIAVFGGFDGALDTWVDHLQIYDPSTDSWEDAAPETGAWACAAVATDDNHLHVFGGQNGQRWYRIYDADGDSWEDGPMLPDPLRRYGHAAVLAPDGRFFLFGGQLSDDTTAIFDPVSQTWAEGPPMPAERAFYAFAADGEYAYLLGGSDNGINDMAPYEDAIWQYDFENELWDTDYGTLATAIREGGGAMVDGAIHVFGGSNGALLDSHQLFGEPPEGGDETTGGAGDSSSSGGDGDGSSSWGGTSSGEGGGATSSGGAEDGSDGEGEGSGTASTAGPPVAEGDGGGETGASDDQPLGPGADVGCGCRTGRGEVPWLLLGLLLAIRGRRARR